MKRRGALAGSLLLTTIAAFIIVAYGSRVGLFGAAGSSGEEPVSAASFPTPTAAPATEAPPQQPMVIDEYIYQDEYVQGGGGGGTGDGGAPAPSSSGRDGSAPPSHSSPQQTSPAPSAPSDAVAPPPQAEENDDSPPPASPGGQELEFSGTVVSSSGSSLTVQTSSGQLSMSIAGASVHGGALVPGVHVSVHATRLPDNSIVAREVEVGAGGSHDEDDDDH